MYPLQRKQTQNELSGKKIQDGGESRRNEYKKVSITILVKDKFTEWSIVLNFATC